MPNLKNKEINELVGGDINANGNDRNVTNNSEIETGPVQKAYNDDSDYQRGQSTTTDRVTSRYRQDIPWFAVYTYGGSRTGGLRAYEGFKITKKTVEEKIEDLVKKSKNSELNEKNKNFKISKLMNMIDEIDFTDKELEELRNYLNNKKVVNIKNIN